MNDIEFGNNILTPDEKVLTDFIKTRTDKALADLEALAAAGSNDQAAWSSAFTYLTKTYGRDSDEPFKWYKYYLRENKIPAEVALPLLIQIYMDSTVDQGFVNIMARVIRREPEDVREARLKDLRNDMAAVLDEEGHFTAYRGSFEKPFGIYDDASRPIEKAFCFTLEPSVAEQYAVCWFPKTAKVYTVSASLEDVVWCNMYDEEKTLILMPQSKGGQFKVTEEKAAAPDQSQNKSSAMAAYHANFVRK
jgi:hypothetical protein